MRGQVPDVYDMWSEHDAERERELAKYPKCDLCGAIMDEVYYKIEGRKMCKSCMEELYEVEVEIDDM